MIRFAALGNAAFLKIQIKLFQNPIKLSQNLGFELCTVVSEVRHGLKSWITKTFLRQSDFEFETIKSLFVSRRILAKSCLKAVE